jgi:hypothetical protein
MKLNNKEIWIILISAIVIISVFGNMVRGAKVITGITIFRDIPLTKEDYQYFGKEEFLTYFYLPDDGCTGFVNYCSYIYASENLSKADSNQDGKIDDADLISMVKAYGCNRDKAKNPACTDSNSDGICDCWNQPVEECFFVISGREFRDPDRDCKMEQDDLDLITANFAKTHNLMKTVGCENNDICEADINQDGVVDILDATIAGVKYGAKAELYKRLLQKKSEADLNDDGYVNILDAVLMASNYGKEAIERRCSREPIKHTSGKEYEINVQGIGINWVQSAWQCPVL